MTSPSGTGNVAPIVQRWNRIAASADSPDAATAKLVHEMLVQIRTIKLILAWVLVFIPVVAATVLIVLAVLAKAEVPEYDTYPYEF